MQPTQQPTNLYQKVMTYQYTGAVQTYTVPVGVTLIEISAAGAAGGSGYNSNQWGPGGLGGYISTLLSVSPGQVYYVYVGGMGASRTTYYGISHSSGGYNGGGSCAGPNTGEGGGGTDVRRVANDVTTRIIVSGGGGGGQSWNNGGNGGGLLGGNGLGGCTAVNGGSQTAGGTSSAGSACAGSLYQGGGCSISNSAGGGGGYYGGAGGGCSGGGGSSYTSGTVLFNLQGVHAGNGNVTIVAIKPHPSSQPSRQPSGRNVPECNQGQRQTLIPLQKLQSHVMILSDKHSH